ncbi:uncharacterized protein LOC144120080 [Amblyomma americanum]
MAHHQLPEYDDQSDNWKAYITKVEAYFAANGVSDSGKKRALLVEALSTRTVQVLSGQVAPRKPNSLTYEEAVKVLDAYFDPKRHEITESYRFFNRCQLEGSSHTPAMHAVLSEFKDVFSPELGLIDGHPVHVKLKEGAMPRFYHQPLVGLLKADRPTPALAAARIQRWALYLGGFRYQLQYSPGKQLLNADALSRLPQRTSEPKPPEADTPDYLLALSVFDEGTVSVEELRQLTAGGPALSQGQRTQAGEWPLPLPEATVYARYFGRGEKWTPGIVESTTGSRMGATLNPSDHPKPCGALHVKENQYSDFIIKEEEML